MKYIAKDQGFFKGTLIERGDEVEAPEGIKSKWLVPAGEYKPEPGGPEVKEPSTFSEIARRGPAAPPKTSPGRELKARASDKPVI